VQKACRLSSPVSPTGVESLVLHERSSLFIVHFIGSSREIRSARVYLCTLTGSLLRASSASQSTIRHVSAWKAERGSCPTRRHAREETASVEFKLERLKRRIQHNRPLSLFQINK